MAVRLIVSTVVMAAGYGVLMAIRHRYNTGARSVRNFAIYFAVAFAILVGVALSSEDYEVRCRDDPTQFCTYNDGVPAMATTVFIFVVAVGYRSWYLFDHR